MCMKQGREKEKNKKDRDGRKDGVKGDGRSTLASEETRKSFKL